MIIITRPRTRPQMASSANDTCSACVITRDLHAFTFEAVLCRIVILLLAVLCLVQATGNTPSLQLVYLSLFWGHYAPMEAPRFIIFIILRRVKMILLLAAIALFHSVHGANITPEQIHLSATGNSNITFPLWSSDMSIRE